MLPQRIIALRQEKGLTQNELAERLKISRSALSLYELGKRQPDYETLQKIAKYFDVTTDYLLGLTDNPKGYSDEPPSDMELEELLKHSNIKFNGEPLDEEDKQDIIEFLKVAWKTIRKKKRK
ncbi:MAG: helix-turn-helix transcriptional regulator [Thermoanaerobacteraceae bacterium]|nr:helix-turn-helix transcriptional regulator [Thermoanaerobacteraceae bacterium]